MNNIVAYGKQFKNSAICSVKLTHVIDLKFLLDLIVLCTNETWTENITMQYSNHNDMQKKND